MVTINNSDNNWCDAFLFSTNGRRPWCSCELTAALRHETVYGLGVIIAIQVWQHLTIAIDHFYLQGIGAQAFGNLYDEAAGIGDSADEYNWHYWQAGHTARVGNTVYGNSAAHGPNLMDIVKHNYLCVSKQWQCIAGLGDGTLPEPDSENSISAAVVAVPAASVLDLVVAASSEELCAALVDHILDGDADFRSAQQRQALCKLVQRNADNANVLLTGSGKSFLLKSSTKVAASVLPIWQRFPSQQVRRRQGPLTFCRVGMGS